MTTSHLFDRERKYSRNPIVNEIRDWLDNWSTDEFRMYKQINII